jgi:hypothetical protein
MATALKLRRGTTTQHSTFTGAEGEITVDTTKDTAVVHDGTTAGGFPLVTETGTQTLTNKTLASPVITGASILPAGSASAPSITTTGDTNTGIFFPAADTIAFAEGGAESMRIDSSGNLGLGVTPSAWGANYKALQQSAGVIASYLTGSFNVGQNFYDSGAGAFKYVNTGYSSKYELGNGAHYWYTAPSGTAGNAITFTERMILNTSGALGFNGANYGTSGQVLTSGGSAAAPAWTNVGGGLIGYQVFTSSGSYTKGTNNPTYVLVEVLGGGGAGYMKGGGGGGNGAYAIKRILASSLSSSETVTIGAGGASQTGSGVGNAGGTSSFGAFVTANGGPGGQLSTTPGTGATASGGDLNVNGGNISAGINGMDSRYGNGGKTGSTSNTTGSATGFGAGGGAVTDTSVGNKTNGAGAGGLVIVWEYK